MSESPDKFKDVTSKDRCLIRFIISESKNYDRWEIFLRAQEQVPSLKQENVLNLYLRYHRFLYPLITGKSSDECVDTHRSGQKPSNQIEDTHRSGESSSDESEDTHRSSENSSDECDDPSCKTLEEVTEETVKPLIPDWILTPEVTPELPSRKK